VPPENREHAALIIVLEMKEAVPRDDASKHLSKGDSAHVSDKPLASRKPIVAKRYHGLGCVEARHLEPKLEQIFCYRYAASAAQVENRSRRRHIGTKMAMPDLFYHRLALPGSIPMPSVPLIEVNNLFYRVASRNLLPDAS
jgi:hypothetical protein